MNNNTGFQFKSRELKLLIADKEFVIDLAQEGAIDALLDVGSEAVSKAAELKKIPITGTAEEKARKSLDVINQAGIFTLEAIDKMLGEGAVDKIFEGRRKDYYDAMDVLDHVVSKVKQANADMMAERSSQYSNRAQKRAATKKKKA
jgi:hypothetical protein